MSTVPAALSGLVAALRVSPAVAALRIDGQPPVRIQDGPWFERPSEPDVIVIGWVPDEGSAADVTVTRQVGSYEESYPVVCLISSWSGDTDIAARRLRADALLEAVRAELIADPTLGGVVTLAELDDHAWDQHQTGQGCEVPIVFTISIEATHIT